MSKDFLGGKPPPLSPTSLWIMYPCPEYLQFYWTQKMHVEDLFWRCWIWREFLQRKEESCAKINANSRKAQSAARRVDFLGICVFLDGSRGQGVKTGFWIAKTWWGSGWLGQNGLPLKQLKFLRAENRR